MYFQQTNSNVTIFLRSDENSLRCLLKKQEINRKKINSCYLNNKDSFTENFQLNRQTCFAQPLKIVRIKIIINFLR